HAVADRQVRALNPFPAADVDDVWIRGRDDDRSDGTMGRLTEKWLPRAAGIRGLPAAAVTHTYIEGVRLARMSSRALRAAGSWRAGVAPAGFGKGVLVRGGRVWTP